MEFPSHNVFSLFVIIVVTSVVSTQGYNPYSPGQYDTDSIKFQPKSDGIPLHTAVYFPTTTGPFTPVLFVGGMYGWAFSEMYSTLLTNLASRGYIVVGMDRYYPPVPQQPDPLSLKLKTLASKGLEEGIGLELFMNTSLWIKSHLANRISAKADWSKTALLCHSAGCDDTLLIVNLTQTFAQASVYLDAMSISALTLQSINSRVKTLAYMSQMSEEKPECCLPGTDYKKIYDLMNCTKVRMQIKDFGHCDALDNVFWEACHLAHACKTTNNTRIETYHNFAAGVIDGFLQWTLYGNSDMQNYVTNQAFMPLQLVDLAYDVTC